MSAFDISKYQVSKNGPLTGSAKARMIAIRDKLNLTYAQMGDAIGLSGAFAYNIMNKQQNVSTTHIERIANGIAALESGNAPTKQSGSISVTPYTCNLRTDFSVEFKLPTNMSIDERDRLSLFVRSLPAN